MVALLKFYNLTFRLNLLLMLFVASILTVIFYTFITPLHPEMVNKENYYRDHTLQEREHQLSEQLSSLKTSVNYVSAKLNVLATENKSEVNIREFLLNETERSESVLFYAGIDGRLVSNNSKWETSQSFSFDISRNAYYDLTKKAETLIEAQQHDLIQQGFWTEIYIDEFLDEFVIGYAVPIFASSRFIGIVGQVTKIDPLIKLNTEVDVSSGIKFFIHNSNGAIISHPDYGLKLLRQMDTYSSGNINREIVRDSLADFISQNLKLEKPTSYGNWEKQFVTSSSKINGTPWWLVAFQAEEKIEERFNEVVNSYLLLSVMLLFMSALFGSTLVHYLFVSPLKKLTRTLKSQELFSTAEFAKNDDNISDLAHEIEQRLISMNADFNRVNKEISVVKLESLENKALAQAVTFSDNAVVLLDLEFEVMYVDAKTLNLLGVERESIMKMDYFELIHPFMGFIPEQIVNEIRRKNSWRGELILQHFTSKAEVWVNCSITPMRDETGNIIRYVVSHQDISSIKDSQNKIERLAYIDDLTGMSNRTFFVAQLEKLIEISKRGRYDFALLYFDLDDFKKVNDLYGHEGGDQLLKEFADRINKRLWRQ